MMFCSLRQSQESVNALGNSTNSVAHFITVLLIFALVLGLTYLTTRFVAKTQQGRLHSGNMEVIETLAIAQNRFLQIVRIGQKYILIAVGKDEISMLMELSAEEIILAEAGKSRTVFDSILEKVKRQGEPESSDKQKD